MSKLTSIGSIFLTFASAGALAYSSACSSSSSHGTTTTVDGGGTHTSSGSSTGSSSSHGTSTASSSSSSSTSKGSDAGSNDNMCYSMSAANCGYCCDNDHPDGASVFYNAFNACICTTAHCQTQCATSDCDNADDAGDTTDACAACENQYVLPDGGGTCGTMIATACNAAPDCVADNNCYSKCPDGG
jgi:hypothetical protein